MWRAEALNPTVAMCYISIAALPAILPEYRGGRGRSFHPFLLIFHTNLNH